MTASGAFEVKAAAGSLRAEDLESADVVILAVPDTLIGKLAAELSPLLAPGTMVITLDAAAPFAGHLPDRPDLVAFGTDRTSLHPVRHPPPGVRCLDTVKLHHRARIGVRAPSGRPPA